MEQPVRFVEVWWPALRRRKHGPKGRGGGGRILVDYKYNGVHLLLLRNLSGTDSDK